MDMKASSWRAQWVLTTLAAAASATAVDAVLLQRKWTYFTGGFLSTDHVTSAAQAIEFLLSSLAADAAVVGVIVALVLWSAARLKLGRRVAAGAAFVLSLGLIVVSDVIQYQLLTYLGDAFDFALMFGLAGRNVGEVFAVSSEHVYRFGAIAAGVAVLLGGLATWLFRRSRTTASAALARVPFGRALALALAVFVAATVGTAFARMESDVLDNGLKRKPSGQMLGLITAELSDFDGDGYGLLGRLRDPDPFDAAIHPYALEIPGNGVDEDGVGGDLPSSAPPYVEESGHAPMWRSKRDVLLVLLESFRADAADVTVGGKRVTPVLAALAVRGIQSHVAYSHNGYTVQSRHHIFSGSIADIRGDETLIDDFKSNGYDTAYFSAQDESFGGPQWGVGFDRADTAFDARADLAHRYSTFATAGSLALPFNIMTEHIASYLHGRTSAQPLFLYVNFHDTHFPYYHPGIKPLVSSTRIAQFDISPERKDALREMYMNTAANVDRAIGEVIASFTKIVGREPAVIVLSDHGESLYDEGFLGHGYALNDVQTRIPFVAANLPLVIEEPFEQADLRGEIWKALDAPDQDAAPVVRQNPEHTVFQYLGTIDTPAQIAFTGLSSQIIYDFRTERVSIDRGAPKRVTALSPGETTAFLRLVQTWERMKLARSAARRSVE